MFLFDHDDSAGGVAVLDEPQVFAKRTLRDYQRDAVADTLRDLTSGTQSTVVVLPTGMGKTVLLASLAANWQHGNVLILAHRIELLEQTADKLCGELGYRPPIEQGARGLEAEAMWTGGNVVVGSVATLRNLKRMGKYRESPFGLVIIDECFPAGTLVDGHPIESIRCGDIVTAFCEQTGEFSRRKVTRVFCKRPSGHLLTVYADGRLVNCTAEHPFFTSRGWVNAGQLKVGDLVLWLSQDAWMPERAWRHVDLVEAHEPTSDGRFGGLCPDGLVYNLEVEGWHTYTANGFVVHNCHHATAASYRKVMEACLEYDRSCKFLGVTATPNRSDNTALGIVFDAVSYAMDLKQAIDLGWLVPIHQEYVHLDEDAVDFSNLTLTRNKFGEADFPREQLEAVLTEENALHAMSRPILDKTTNGEQCLIFNAGVAHAHLMAAVLNRYKPASAAAVDGKTDPAKRAEIVNRFHGGDIQYLLNFGIFTEGFDAPSTSMVVMARPTKSVSLYTQIIGRGTRPLPGVVDGPTTPEARRAAIAASAKKNMTVLDFVGNSRHKPASVTDVLGGNYDVQVRELAEQVIREKGRDCDVQEALDDARVDLALLKEEQRRKEIIAAAVRYSTSQVDVFGSDAMPVGNDMSIARGGCSDGQIALLVNYGIRYETAAGYTKRQAGAIIENLKAKRCSNKQRNILSKYGYDPNVPAEKANAIIKRIIAAGWRRPDGE